MKSGLLNSNASQTYALIFEKGDKLIETLEQFAKENKLDAAHFTAIGGFSEVRLEYFSREKMDYVDIPVDQQVEVLTLTGNISLQDDGVKVHSHAVLGLSDGTTRGGHIGEATVWPTLEIVLEEEPVYLRRKKDPETGLTLIDLNT